MGWTIYNKYAKPWGGRQSKALPTTFVEIMN
jgi:hypothetical protein